MTDKELLELAAKAHGGLVYIDDMGWIHDLVDKYGNRGLRWNPINDDCDALKLAVKLKIDIHFENNLVLGDFVEAFTPERVDGSRKCFYESTKTSPCLATRRAIVRAAAEIGKENT